MTKTVPNVPKRGLFSRASLMDVRQDCVLCDAADVHTLCTPCAAALPRASHACPVCATPNQSGVSVMCGACVAAPPAIDAALAAFQYQFPLDRLVQSFKFSANLALVDFFAEALAARLRTQCVPLHGVTLLALPLANRRLATRGFNQSALLADALGKRLGLPVAHSAMLRIRETPPQSGLSRQARLKNIHGAFDCAVSLAGQHIALIDDVMTTGATLSEAARVLKKAGAAKVEAWVLARAVME